MTVTKKYSVRYLLPVLLWMLLIFISSSLPPEDFPKVEFWGWAKLIHLIYYGVLCFLIQRALRQQEKFPLLAHHALMFGIVFAVLYGATDEYHQLFTPGRHAQLTDVLIDGLGASLFIAGFWAYRLWKPGAQAGAQPGD